MFWMPWVGNGLLFLSNSLGGHERLEIHSQAWMLLGERTGITLVANATTNLLRNIKLSRPSSISMNMINAILAAIDYFVYKMVGDVTSVRQEMMFWVEMINMLHTVLPYNEKVDTLVHRMIMLDIENDDVIQELYDDLVLLSRTIPVVNTSTIDAWVVLIVDRAVGVLETLQS